MLYTSIRLFLTTGVPPSSFYWVGVSPHARPPFWSLDYYCRAKSARSPWLHAYTMRIILDLFFKPLLGEGGLDKDYRKMKMKMCPMEFIVELYSFRECKPCHGMLPYWGGPLAVIRRRGDIHPFHPYSGHSSTFIYPAAAAFSTLLSEFRRKGPCYRVKQAIRTTCRHVR